MSNDLMSPVLHRSPCLMNAEWGVNRKSAMQRNTRILASAKPEGRPKAWVGDSLVHSSLGFLHWPGT